ncbi:MAG: oxidoreductase, partial [Flavobacteriaceae bacterium]
GGGITGIIHDFRSGVIHRDNRSNKIKISGKGHKQEVSAFVQAIVEGKDSPVSFQSIYDTTLTTFKIQDSLRTGLPQKI